MASEDVFQRTSSDTVEERTSFIKKELPSKLGFEEDELGVRDRVELRDPRLEDYPIPLVADTVDLSNDDKEPLPTFRFWVLSTFWVLVGCSVSSVYYFKPYSVRLTGYVVQLCSWAVGMAMAKHLPTGNIRTLGLVWSLNPGPWNAKEHALVVVAYWGSSYTAYGLGPLSAMELYYNKPLSPLLGVSFLMTSQLMGYGLAGLFRDLLVRPPQMYYPGVLPSVALFNAMHKDPSTTSRSLYRIFCLATLAAFAYQLLPSLVWPMLSSLPLLCYMGRGSWKAFVLGSGTYGFGLLDLSLDWNYVSFFSPLYTPLWANANRFVGAVLACWVLYPLAYFSDTLSALSFAPMSSETWDDQGARYNISAVLTPANELDRGSLDSRSIPRWSLSYSMHFFFGFASTSALLMYAVLFHGRSAWEAAWAASKPNYDDPYLELTSHLPRVPQSWYIILCAVCLTVAVIQLYAGEMQLPWWGLLLIVAISALFTVPSGILFALANVQIGMDYMSELIAGTLFPGKPLAVLTSTVYGRQVLEQCLNLVSDLKFGFYMKIPERALFVAQVYGTVLGPLVNWACMRVIIDTQGGLEGLTGASSNTSGGWNALKTRNFYSISVLWGVLGPRALLSAPGYSWLCYGFAIGPLAVLLLWTVHMCRPGWNLGQAINPAVIFSGASLFPVYPTANLGTSMLAAVVSMGYARRWHPRWFRRYNYLLGSALDCGSQLVQMFVVLLVHLAGITMPHWWGNDAVAVDRCFPPTDLPPSVLN